MLKKNDWQCHAFIVIWVPIVVNYWHHHLPLLKRSSNAVTTSIGNVVLIFRSSPPELFLRKGVLKICSKFTGEHPCRSAISIKLQSNFIEITLGYVCSPVNLLHIFRTPFPKNSSGGLLLDIILICEGHLWI